MNLELVLDSLTELLNAAPLLLFLAYNFPLVVLRVAGFEPLHDREFTFATFLVFLRAWLNLPSSSSDSDSDDKFPAAKNLLVISTTNNGL